MATRYVELVEVSPRDGLQNESVILDTEDKVELINRAVAAGIRRLEAVSFVNPKRVPGWVDADEVVERFRRVEGVQYHVLWLNEKEF